MRLIGVDAKVTGYLFFVSFDRINLLELCRFPFFGILYGHAYIWRHSVLQTNF